MTDGRSFGSRIRGHFGAKILGGIVVLVPAAVTFVVLRALFKMMAGVMDPLVRRIGDLPNGAVAAVSFAALLALLYLVGLTARFFLSKRLVALGEAIVARIPLAGTVYGASKQVIQAFASSDNRAFKGVVWVEFPRPGFYAIAFVTGVMPGPQDPEEFLRLFIPTAPNPTSGFLELVHRSYTKDAGISVDEAMKLIVSGGIVAPPNMTQPAQHAEPASREGQAGDGRGSYREN